MSCCCHSQAMPKCFPTPRFSTSQAADLRSESCMQPFPACPKARSDKPETAGETEYLLWCRPEWNTSLTCLTIVLVRQKTRCCWRASDRMRRNCQVFFFFFFPDLSLTRQQNPQIGEELYCLGCGVFFLFLLSPLQGKAVLAMAGKTLRKCIKVFPAAAQRGADSCMADILGACSMPGIIIGWCEGVCGAWNS